VDEAENTNCLSLLFATLFLRKTLPHGPFPAVRKTLDLDICVYDRYRTYINDAAKLFARHIKEVYDM
jgi:hypothetical protein